MFDKVSSHVVCNIDTFSLKRNIIKKDKKRFIALLLCFCSQLLEPNIKKSGKL